MQVVCALSEGAWASSAARSFGGSYITASQEELPDGALGSLSNLAERKQWVADKLDAGECGVWLHDVTVIQVLPLHAHAPRAHEPTSPRAHEPTSHAHVDTRPHAHTPTRPHTHPTPRAHALTPLLEPLQGIYLANCASRELTSFIAVSPILYGFVGVDPATVGNVSAGLTGLTATPAFEQVRAPPAALSWAAQQQRIAHLAPLHACAAFAWSCMHARAL